MKSELDTIMQARNLDALLVVGPGQHNPAMFYMAGGGHLTQADLIKKCGQEPVLYYNAMERDEAGKTGLQTKNLGDYNFNQLLKETDGDFLKATALRYKKMFEEQGITSGRVAVSGRIDAGVAWAILTGVKALLPDLEFVGEMNDSLFLAAMSTKEPVEIERIRHMGRVTTAVVGLVAEYLTSHPVKNEILMKAEGRPLTIGEVKSQINLWLAERGAENPEGTIFAIGRDAGVPHSSGNNNDIISLGKTIVFDIFPCEAGGGYFYDFTRTWCLGYAPDEAQALYNDVLSVYRQMMQEIKEGSFGPDHQERTCELFEAKGHPTVRSNPQTQDGYVHSLGHGLGLNLHERPWFGKNATPDDLLKRGSVFTVEPGLYYPEKGMGVRLEDSVYVREDGEIEILSKYPLDFVLPMQK